MKPKKTIVGIGTAVVLAISSQIQVNPAPLSINEWQATVSMYDYEIKQAGGSINVQNFQSFSDLNSQIRKRVPTESVIIDGVSVTPAGYSVFRENMMKKVEKRTLINSILN